MESLINFQTDLYNRINKAKSNFKKSPKERITKDYVESRMESLEQMWYEFRIGHKELVQTSDPKTLKAEKYVTEDMYDKADELFTEYKCELKGILSKFKTVSSVSADGIPQGNSLVKPNHVKLPKISIPCFSGKYTEWTSFRDLFISMIHHNDSLDNVQKLHYLKGYLTGEAEQLIRFIPICDANYARCWQQLEARYNNKKYLSHCILKRLLSQKNAASESANYLKELLDTSSDCLSALANLGIDVSTWDIIVIYILTLKLDPETRKQWELNVSLNLSSDDLPTFKQFKEFLTSRFRALEFIDPKGSKSINQNVKHTTVKSNVLHVSKPTTSFSCEFCGDNHKLCFCKKFASEDYDKRHEFVTNNRMCFNCLGSNHSVRFCQKATSCRICKKRHHSLLHPKGGPSVSATLENVGQAAAEVPGEASRSNSASSTTTPLVNCFAKERINNEILLATALVRVESKTGQNQVFRALLDQGSQASFVTEATVQSLGLKKTPVNGTISGLGGQQASTIAKHMVTIKLHSLIEPNFKLEVKAYVLRNITSHLPGKRVVAPAWVELQQFSLADPNYGTPNKIDLLLGAEVYCKVLKDGIKRGPSGTPLAQSTMFGWILSGPVKTTETSHTISVMHACVNEDEVLKRFWELESEPNTQPKMLTVEEQKCEKMFSETTQRDADGRYVVRLPFRDEVPLSEDGNSRQIALKRFKTLERKLSKDQTLKTRYTDVINEYLQLGHMMLVPQPDAKQNQARYLPHHAVVREDKSTTKVRVVFDASCKDELGVSLNDALMVGPTLQPDLRHLIMRWRKYPVCVTADIVKMYRMVKVAEEDVDYQRIVWREDPEKEIQDYKLLTVTFGTASAPYLAVKALNQVAQDHKEEYPLAASRVENEFYMDDLMSGGETLEEGITLYTEMNALLNKGGFILQKWSSNKQELLDEINKNEGQKGNEENKSLHIKDDSVVKILGLTWNKDRDEFQYAVKLPPLTTPVTKRSIISDVARLYDPLGWIAPCVISAKIFIQRLWTAGVGWDEEPPTDIKEDWLAYREELQKLTTFRLPRWLHTKTDNSVVELHGFSDASNLAYSAAVYLRVISASGDINVCLVGAKTKVAPIKQISIPRLELCGAVLLSKLLVETAEVLDIPKGQIRAWTDSTVVLAWLNKHPSTWKTFVANRVSEILTRFDSSQWSHVPTKENPADCASRGVRPGEIEGHALWKHGPNFLKSKTIVYKRPKDNTTKEEEKPVKSHVGIIEGTILDRFSSLRKLLRVVAYCRRFITRHDATKIGPSQQLSKWELDEALTTCLKLVQATAFEADISEIKKHGSVRSKSKLLSLTPFLDHKGLLRVGGRLAQLQVDENTKHPIILPHNSAMTKLIVADAHERTFHSGAQSMLNYLRSAYWIIGVKNLVKHHIFKCITCIRFKADQQTQLMGSLPSVRITPARPFSRGGVDYAGPINLRTSKGRGHHAHKGYICLFVCMVTKALHIEVASDLSSRGFLEAFKRFVARRGHCYELYSDNGTNFVGASKELKDLFNIEKSSMAQEVAESLANQGTKWHFIPPRAPNFGGLWEAGIKSTKFHIKRVIGDSTLTFEEMSTLLSQIEACLNSRPISLLSNVPEDPMPLTPGHFLIGEPLVTIPEINYETSTVSSLKRWQLTQRMLQNFWRRWSNEYLTHYMHRYKWAHMSPEPQTGDIVLVKDDDLPPAKWLFGKIEQKHPGPDNITRVVTLKCKNSFIKRPVSKLCLLPVTRDNEP